MKIRVKNTCCVTYANEEERKKELRKRYNIVLRQLITDKTIGKTEVKENA